MNIQVEDGHLVIRNNDGILKWSVHLSDIETFDNDTPNIKLTFPTLELTQESGLGKKTTYIVDPK